MGLNLLMRCIVGMVFIIGASAAMEYKVGDSFGWNVPTNANFYSDWASTKKFFAGDKLIFNWTGQHTVAIASESDYKNCNSTSPFGSNLNQTTFEVTLDRTGPYNFLCTVSNHCERGQKFNINAENPFSNAPSPQPGSAPPTLQFGILSAFLSSLAVFFFTRTN